MKVTFTLVFGMTVNTTDLLVRYLNEVEVERVRPLSLERLLWQLQPQYMTKNTLLLSFEEYNSLKTYLEDTKDRSTGFNPYY